MGKKDMSLTIKNDVDTRCEVWMLESRYVVTVQLLAVHIVLPCQCF